MATQADVTGLFNRLKTVAAVAAEEGTTNNNNDIKTIIKLVRVEHCFLKYEDRAPTLIFFPVLTDACPISRPAEIARSDVHLREELMRTHWFITQ